MTKRSSVMPHFYLKLDGVMTVRDRTKKFYAR